MYEVAVRIDECPQPNRILAAMTEALGNDQVVSLHFRYRLASKTVENDVRLQWILSQPLLYEAFGIHSIYSTYDYRPVVRFEAIGALANLLCAGGAHQRFCDSESTAYEMAKEYLDLLWNGKYQDVYGFQIGPWCKWFCDEIGLDWTLLLGANDLWWLLAYTDTD